MAIRLARMHAPLLYRDSKIILQVSTIFFDSQRDNRRFTQYTFTRFSLIRLLFALHDEIFIRASAYLIVRFGISKDERSW